MLKMARVVDVHPESHSVDVLVLEDNRRFSGVKVLAWSAGGDYGIAGFAVPTNTGFNAENSGKRDIFAAIAWMGYTPVVVGFVHPEVSQVLFRDKERAIHRFPSDVYVNVDGDGNTELFHPSGAFVRLGVSPAHEDLSGKDADGIWAISRNTDKSVHIHIEQAGGVASVDIAPSGAITINTNSTLDITAEGNTTLTTPTFTINGDVQLNGGAVVTDDVVASGVSLVNHVHSGVQAGSSKTAKPD